MQLADIQQLFTAEALRATAPMLIVSVGILVALLAELVPLPLAGRRAIFPATVLLAFLAELSLLREPVLEPVFASFLADRASSGWGVLFLLSALLAWAFGRRYYHEEKGFLVEHDVLILCSVVGMMLVAGARDLLAFFIGLELLSVPLYALAGFQRSRSRSVEAGLKYFLLGAFSAGIFLYGAALCYAATGSIELAQLAERGGTSPLFLSGIGLVVASLFFKAAIFPFHFWAPDVYQGSPSPVTVFMATGTKAAAFAFLLNLTPLLPGSAAALLALLSLLTLAAGNLGALVQQDLKRLLAFSSVAHAGTLLLLVAALVRGGDLLFADAVAAAQFYVAAYVFTAGGAFGLVAVLEAGGERFTRLDALRGLAQRRPALAAALALFMLSLGGIPATGGFLGKYLVFAIAVRAELVLVAILAILLSVVALAYYLRVIVLMYMEPEPAGASDHPRAALAASIGPAVCAAMVLLLGLLPSVLLDRLG